MGLDMYLRGEKFFWTDWSNPENNRKEDDIEVNTLEVRLGYWRKHPDLHGYIVNEFNDGVDDCTRIDLSMADLQKIVAAVKDKRLPKTSGFFFGESDGTEVKSDIAILNKAIKWLTCDEKGISRSIYYKASW